MNKKEEIFFNGKFKRFYLILTSSICLLWGGISTIFSNSFFTSSNIFPYYQGILLFLILTGMILDEKIRKYPGLLVTLGSSIYCFSYIYLCTLINGFNIYIILYFIYIGVAYSLFKFVYPKIVVIKNGAVIFNTIYLILILSITTLIGIGMWGAL